ncbi:hypothetical protein [Duganella qianjiadongensis]|uniref:Uncharacterized protein n=1 Tax=Duganella qianjiadongensis TaxID=2692176 RepID=A0ABW9VK17_9BURK|nr:hypothetical protein [Duganella qianjiadongensis]MYM39657.1 hypothetical protein [Duganella qianjiadongensis]
MDPMTIAGLINAGSSILKGLGSNSGPTTTPSGPQKADGYAMGGYADTSGSPNSMGSGATGGATGGAYGGAYSQSYLDGSNWAVSTGKSNATGGGKSGGNGGMSPIQSNATGGVSPASPFTFGSGAVTPAGVAGNSSTGLIVLAAAALLIWKL